MGGSVGGGKGGGSSTTNYNYDPETERVIRENMESSQKMAEEAYGYWKKYALPYEKEMYAANRELLPLQERASEAALKEAIYDTEQGREVKDKLREQQLSELEQSAPVSKEFYKQVREGLDPEAEARKAEVDVQSAAAKEKEAMEADLSSYGIDPSSGRYANLDLQRRMNTAKNVVGARTDARTRARDENFARLTAGMAARGKATGLPGTQATSGSGEAFGNYNLQNLANQAGSFYQTSNQAGSTLYKPQSTHSRYADWNVSGKLTFGQ
jgi:hypothetical protein